MLRFKRVHESGTNALITHDGKDAWQVQINFHEPNRNARTITAYLVPTIDGAKSIADKEVLKYGHVCNGVCEEWFQVP